MLSSDGRSGITQRPRAINLIVAEAVPSVVRFLRENVSAPGLADAMATATQWAELEAEAAVATSEPTMGGSGASGVPPSRPGAPMRTPAPASTKSVGGVGDAPRKTLAMLTDDWSSSAMDPGAGTERRPRVANAGSGRRGRAAAAKGWSTRAPAAVDPLPLASGSGPAGTPRGTKPLNVKEPWLGTDSGASAKQGMSGRTRSRVAARVPMARPAPDEQLAAEVNGSPPVAPSTRRTRATPAPSPLPPNGSTTLPAPSRPVPAGAVVGRTRASVSGPGGAVARAPTGASSAPPPPGLPAPRMASAPGQADALEASSSIWTHPPVFLIRPVQGAPGDGNESLSRAIKAAMRAKDVAITEDPRQADYAIQGVVEVGPPFAGRQRAKIVWTVLTLDGLEMGTARQENAVPAGSLDGPWGHVAAMVSDAAVNGVRQLFKDHFSRSAPGNRQTTLGQ